jgi:hypothetical protein
VTNTRKTLRPALLPPPFWRADGNVWRYERNGLTGSLWSAGTERLVQGGPSRLVAGPGGVIRDDVLTIEEHEQWALDLVPMLRYLRAARAGG